MPKKTDDARDGVETVLSARAPVAPDEARTFTLRVVEGPDVGAHIEVTAADPSRMLIGQSSACALRLRDREVSRRHAAVDVRGHRLFVTDLESTNGTLANGIGIREGFLEGGETLRVGQTSIRVESGAAGPVSLPNALSFGRVVGGSPSMRRLYPLCERLAAADIPLLIEGETGTGKEVLAESIHEQSTRAAGPFVVFDCTAVPANLAESTLFGHERGAFTGAVSARRGVFELADGGTLFIDEVGDLDILLQPKLLRAIERAEVQRVGSERWLRVNVRVVSATRRNLDLEVQEGRFRDDLFFRLAVARLELPPLRERTGDVGLLARHFWRRLGGKGTIPAEFLQRLHDYSFPGNVRELHNLLARRIALGDLDQEIAGSVPPPPPTTSTDFIEQVLAEDLPLAPSRQRVLNEFERRYTARLLARFGGDSALAAAASGIARRYFQIIRARQAR